jgi:RES domain-containing protein
MRVFRLSKQKFSNDLSGKGAEITGGRWNSKGTAILYTCESRALCTTEIAVHMPLGLVPDAYMLIEIEFPDDIKVKKLLPAELPEEWKAFPHPHSTQVIGDQFIAAQEYLVMKVPSVVVRGDYNYLFNPRHQDFNKVKAIHKELFGFDERLFIK